MYDILYDIIVLEPSTFFYCIMWACDNVTVTVCDGKLWHYTNPNSKFKIENKLKRKLKWERKENKIKFTLCNSDIVYILSILPKVVI